MGSPNHLLGDDGPQPSSLGCAHGGGSSPLQAHSGLMPMLDTSGPMGGGGLQPMVGGGGGYALDATHVPGEQQQQAMQQQQHQQHQQQQLLAAAALAAGLPIAAPTARTETAMPPPPSAPPSPPTPGLRSAAPTWQLCSAPTLMRPAVASAAGALCRSFCSSDRRSPLPPRVTVRRTGPCEAATTSSAGAWTP